MTSKKKEQFRFKYITIECTNCHWTVDVLIGQKEFTCEVCHVENEVF